MALKEQLNQEYIVAMKNKEERKVSVLRMLKNAIKNQEIEVMRELSEEEMHAVVRRLIKQSADALQDFERGGREDLIKQAKEEIAQFQTYVPAELSEESILKIIDEIIIETGAKTLEDLGRIMGAVMKKTAGCANGNTVRALATKRLS